MGRKYIIVGGVAGGASAAARLRRNDEAAEIILLERGGYISFANCGLPYYIGNVIGRRSSLLVQTPEAMKARFNIDVRLHHEAVGLDCAEKRVEIRDLARGSVYSERYDELILATGSSPVLPPIPGIDGPGIHTIWTIPDTDAIKARTESGEVKRAVVVGGGFVGVEMAENLRALGAQVTQLEMVDQVLGPLDRDMAQYIHRELRAQGVDLRLGAQVVRFEPAGAGTRVFLKSGETVDADLVVMAAGIRPNSELARAGGLKCNERGYVVTDEHLRTSDAHVFAVGDVIELTDFVTGNRTVLPLAGPANKQGRIAADNACGASVVYTGTQGTSVAQVFDLTFSSTGLNEKGLQRAGKKLHEDYEVIYGHGANHASYFPGSTPLHTKLLFEPKGGRILGMQAIGRDGTEKRVDVVATAMRFRASVCDLTELDLAYAPPFNTAKDPVNFLGYMGENILGGKVRVIQWHELAGLDAAEYQIVDVRQPDEFEAGAIPGATLIPLPEIRARLAEFDRSRTVVVYCKAGLRSYIAARILSQNGFRVLSLPGGWTTYEVATWSGK